MKIKFPSFNEISQSTLQTVKRFPVALFYSFILVVYSIFLVHNQFDDDRYYYALHVLSLGIIISVGITIFSELKKLASGFKIALNLVVFILLVGYFFLFDDYFNAKILYRILIITFVFILMLLSLPYFNKNNQLNFWRYNFLIFNRFVLSALYSIIIYSGLSIALLVINLLFNANIDPEFFFDLWIVIVGIFAVANFLSAFPKEFFYKDEFDYPKSLRVFVQFILLPLTTIYLTILYAYVIKILFTWELPQGSISYLVLSFSAVGLISLMIIFPIKDNDNFKWIKTYSKYFFYAIIPLIILLFVSIFIRISEYGITENRFYIVIFAFWLAVIAIYSLVSNFKNIKIISISFAFLFFAVSFGPWSSFNISKISQLNKLQQIISENNLLPNGQISSDMIELPDSVYEQFYDVSDYLIENHGIKVIENKFNLDLDSIDTLGYSTWSFVDFMNISQSYDYYDDFDSTYYYFDLTGEFTCLNIENFDSVYKFNYSYYDSLPLRVGNVKIDNIDQKFIFYIDSDSAVFNYNDFILNMIDEYDNTYFALNPEQSEINLIFDNFILKIIINNLYGYFQDSKFSEITFSGLIFIDKIDNE
ncbi:MAG: DUF4153 domain-containing protein [Bacteroidales bacterium]|nr:DUF4153 domain-containing protein [Bacteroidales bacterium]